MPGKDNRTQGAAPALGERLRAEGLGPGEHSGTPFDDALLDVLRPRTAVEDSPFGDHLTRLRKELRCSGAGADHAPKCGYDPQGIRMAMRTDPRVFGRAFEARTRECSEIVENGCAVQEHIDGIRARGAAALAGAPDRGLVRPVTVTGEDGIVREIIDRARYGANAGRSTKSAGLDNCSHPSWRRVSEKYGLRGAAGAPTFACGAWLGGLSAGEYGDWRQDYLCTLIYGFYLEYNLDTIDSDHPNHVLRDLACMWDMPGLPPELRARKAHMLCDMAYFDRKRRSEAALHSQPTTGMTAWVFGDRDLWRDYKACDSALFGHYLSFRPGTVGRDDLMVAGVVNDWIDIGPDLRNGECAQSVLALTGGSIASSDLLRCYERSVWMLNAQLTPSADIEPERFPASALAMCTCVWGMANHRHDIWRYYSIAAEALTHTRSLDLYRSCQLADCYSEDLLPTTPVAAARIAVPRRAIRYDCTIAGVRHHGEIEVHTTVADSIESGVFPMKALMYQLIAPLLLFRRAITPAEFLAHMDRSYCEHHTVVIDAAHRARFSREFVTALILLVMEQWWSGILYAIGVGSLAEAQPGRIGNDRIHPEETP
ncbi:hypothetical protein [Nocardia thraciensis]